MESKWVKVLDNGHRIIVDAKRKRAAQCAANIIEASHKVLSVQPNHNSLFTKLGKRKRLVGCKTKCGVHSRKSLHKNYSNFMKVDCHSGSQKPIAWIDESDLDIVKNMLVVGMNPSLNANKQIEITQRYRGDPNVRYAWLASTKDALPSIMTYGLAHCGLKTKATYGFGVHLAAVKCALTSASYCDVDENGIQHMVFCLVILGNMELVHPGSRQFHPTSENFDSGVDDLQNPSHYIVWNMNMITHIYLEYVVSFKMSHSAEVETERNCHPRRDFVDKSQGNTPSIGSSTSKTPKSPWMPFAILFDAISNKIDPKDTKLLNIHYDLFRVTIQFYMPAKSAEGGTRMLRQQ
ncbi:unnamed protein product [Camellia sinensis]